MGGGEEWSLERGIGRVYMINMGHGGKTTTE